MLAIPKTPALLTLPAVLLLFLSTSAYADPIGSLKSVKNYKTISIKDAPFNLSSNGDSQTTISSNIARSQFTTAVVNREPTDNVVMLTNNSSKIYYFSELANLAGQRVTHRWQYQGKLMAEVKFDVKSDRWRVFSSKKIHPDWTGEWLVDLVDENGNSLTTTRLEVVSASSNN